LPVAHDYVGDANPVVFEFVRSHVRCPCLWVSESDRRSVNGRVPVKPSVVATPFGMFISTAGRFTPHYNRAKIKLQLQILSNWNQHFECLA
jgi:hypothetical protein